MPSSLDTQLASLPEDVQATLRRFHFDVPRFHQLAERVLAGEAAENQVTGKLSPPRPEDIQALPAKGSAEYSRLQALGRAALEAGQVALAVLAGGMATRMGGVVKALVEVLPGKTFLDLRLAEIAAYQQRYGKAPPLWLMASSATEGRLKDALGSREDGEQVAVFNQFSSLRLTPQGDIYRDANGRPSEHASGHGDFPEALQRSGLIQRFVAAGGKVVMLTNLDNLGATLDEAIIGFHLAHGQAVTSEVVDKQESDRGGIPIYVDDTLCVLEEFRIPPSFDPKTVRVFNTNVFHFDARALSELAMPWTFFLVNKKVGTDPVIQFERLVNEVTSYLPTRYLHVPRTGAESRFLPVKDDDELKLRRAENELVARARGML
jgi:UTP--glucose-1-phosphate uridylyltransferase